MAGRTRRMIEQAKAARERGARERGARVLIVAHTWADAWQLARKAGHHVASTGPDDAVTRLRGSGFTPFIDHYAAEACVFSSEFWALAYAATFVHVWLPAGDPVLNDWLEANGYAGAAQSLRSTAPLASRCVALPRGESDLADFLNEAGYANEANIIRAWR